MMYGSLGLNGLFAGLGLALALRHPGGLRERLRAEPLMGLLGLLAAYQLASIPSDLLWHQIIGLDISAWSLPHLLLTLTSNATTLTGVALALAGAPAGRWRPLWAAPRRGGELLALGLITAASLFLLQFLTTEWEWFVGTPGRIVAERPDWTYPVVVLLAGVAISHLALHTTRRVGAASLVALLGLLVQLVTIRIDRALLPPGPILASHLLLLPTAVLLDLWYARAAAGASSWRSVVVGAGLYAGLYYALAFPYLGAVLPYPRLDGADWLAALLIGAPSALAVALAAARFGGWLAGLGVVRQPLDAPVQRVGDVEVPGAVERDRVRLLELADSLTEHAPGAS
jgi:hypothetical protein